MEQVIQLNGSQQRMGPTRVEELLESGYQRG